MLPAYTRQCGSDLMFQAIIHNNVEDVVALLEDQEVNIDCRNVNGLTPLNLAVQMNHLGFTELFLKYGANPDLSDNVDIGLNCPIHRAVEQNNIEILQMLIDYNAGLNLKNESGFTPLHVACRKNLPDIVKMLLIRGADGNIRDKFGNNATFWAQYNNFQDILKIEGLPPPLHISKEELMDHRLNIRKTLGLKPPKFKKKGMMGKGKGKGKKKK